MNTEQPDYIKMLHDVEKHLENVEIQYDVAFVAQHGAHFKIANKDAFIEDTLDYILVMLSSARVHIGSGNFDNLKPFLACLRRATALNAIIISEIELMKGGDNM